MSDPVKGSIASRLAERVAHTSAVEGNQVEEDAFRGTRLADPLPAQELVSIPLDLISPAADGQVRKDFDEERLKALAESLKRSGVREPIIVTPHGAEPGRFQIVAGERRWRAAQLAGLAEVPCIVDASLVERKDKLLAQAEENLHRENLNPVEEAAVLAQLMEARGIDVREAGELMGRSYRQARRLQQIHAAPAPIRRALSRGEIDLRIALELTRTFNAYAREDESPFGKVAARRIDALVERVVREAWSVKRLERFAAKAAGEGAAAAAEEPGGQSPSVVAAPNDAAGVGRPGDQRRALVARRDGLIVIDAGRLENDEVLSEERAALIALLEEVLTKARHLRVRQ